MKITHVQRPAGAWHLAHLRLEEVKPKRYFADRGLKDIMITLALNPDLGAHFEAAYQEKGAPLEFLEGGCGQGKTLADFRRSLGDIARFTGITLNPKHVEAMQRLPPELRPDEVIVGPLEYHEFDRKFDFIFDHLGAVYYFPATALRKYSQIISEKGMILTRIPLYDHCITDRIGTSENRVEGAKKLIFDSGLEIKEFRLDYQDMDAMLRKNKNITVL